VPLFERHYLTGSFYLYHSFSVIVARPLSFTLIYFGCALIRSPEQIRWSESLSGLQAYPDFRAFLKLNFSCKL
jgi:hypothetical protein